MVSDFEREENIIEIFWFQNKEKKSKEKEKARDRLRDRQREDLLVSEIFLGIYSERVKRAM